MTPLQIVHVTNEPFGLDTANGVQHVAYCLARCQGDMGHSVVVFSREDDAVNFLGERARSVERGARERRRAFHSSLRRRLLSHCFEDTLTEKVLSWQPDIVHFHSVHIPQNVALAEHLVGAGIPYCVTVHGALFAPALRRGRLKKTVFKLLLERHYLNQARFVHAVSPQESGAIERYGVDRPIVMVPNGVPLDAYARALRPDALYTEIPWLCDRRVFMFIGRLDPWQKGLDLLIEGFAQARLRDAGLVLVGPDCRGSRQELSALADRLGVLSQLAFLAPAFGEARADLLQAADVFVHPSRWEGLSLSVLVAAAAGKPCLITREADPLGELERAQAAIVVEASAASIAQGLRGAAALDGDELRLMGARARRVADAHFTWPSIARQMVEAYRGALGKGAVSAADGQLRGEMDGVEQRASAPEVEGRDNPHHR